MEDTQTQQTSVNWVAGKTKNGKTIKVLPDGTGLFRIELTSGGKLPKELSGRYTGITAAQEAVNAYLVKASYVHKRDKERKAREGNDGKTVN